MKKINKKEMLRPLSLAHFIAVCLKSSSPSSYSLHQDLFCLEQLNVTVVLLIRKERDEVLTSALVPLHSGERVEHPKGP